MENTVSFQVRTSETIKRRAEQMLSTFTGDTQGDKFAAFIKSVDDNISFIQTSYCPELAAQMAAEEARLREIVMEFVRTRDAASL